MNEDANRMQDDVMLSAALATELSRLDGDQRAAVLHDGNVAILAGPGAGKTRTLVSRIGWLLTTMGKHRGVAAITYTDATAREVETRLGRLGLVSGRRLSSRTVHGFCVGHVLPYDKIAGMALPEDLQIIDDDEAVPLWEEALGEAHVPLGRKGVAGERTVLKKLRRRRAVENALDEMVGGHDEAALFYRQRLREEHKLDFDEIPILALEILRSSSAIGGLIAARFPHLVVDEYQDLGPVLHAIVAELLRAGVKVTAVGDPDQTMYEYEGADPRYLRELADREDFREFALKRNYRSGKKLIVASTGVLGVDRGYQADPNRSDPGVIDIDPVIGDLDQHAERCVEVVNRLTVSGTPLEDIAILYPGPTDLRQQIVSSLSLADIRFDVERGRRIPGGSVGEFVSACAARRLSGPLPGGETTPSGSGHHRVSTIRLLARISYRLRLDAGIAAPDDSERALARTLVGLLDHAGRPQPADDASAFVQALRDAMNLSGLTSNSRDGRDRSLVAKLDEAVAEGLTMAELAGRRAPGRLTLTTYHSAKGREFSAVVLPGLIDGLVPFFFANQPLAPGELADARRKFYVAITRAEHTVVLVPGTQFTTSWGWGGTRVSTWSRFVIDIQAAVADFD